MPTSNFKAVVWDMDGLLIDSERLSFVAWKRGAEAINQVIDESVFGELIGRTSSGIHEKLTELLGSHVDVLELRREANIAYSKIIDKGVPLMKGARECIELLDSLGVPQAVATSSELHRAEQKLGHHGLLKHFKTLVTGDQVQKGKPEPEPYLIAASRLGVSPNECIAFEDSVNGVLSATSAGMRTILVPDLAIHDEVSRSRAWRCIESLELAIKILKDEFEK